MENRRILKSILKSSVFRAACWGAVLLGAVTLAVDYYNDHYGPKSGHGSWGMLFSFILAVPSIWFAEATGGVDSAIYQYLSKTVGGYWIGVLINALFGATTFAGFALLKQLYLKTTGKDEHD